MSYILCADDTARKISAAYFNNYIHGFVHPDRVMKEHDLIYMCDGEWEIYLEETPILLKKNFVLILPAGVHHYGLQKCLDGTRTMFIHVSAEKDDFRREKFEESSDTGKIPLGLLTDCAHAQNVKRLFENIIEEFSSVNVYRDNRMTALYHLLLTELYSARCAGKGEVQEELVKEMLRVIREEPGRFHTVKELAELFFVSPRTAAGHFKEATGVSVHKFEMNMKLDSAAAFIRDYPHIKLREVARNFGFYDEFHFSKAFSQRFSVSPAAYRNHDLGNK